MAINAPETSSNVNSSCATCLRRFTIHFRRDYKIFDTPTTYGGEFGFDWLRDEYINPMLETIESEFYPVFVDTSKYGVERLKSTYKDGIKVIMPFGKEYVPASINLFPEKFVKDNNKSNLNFEAVLDIEIHQFKEDEAPLENDIFIEFITTNKNIKISLGSEKKYKAKIKVPISELIKDGQKELVLNSKENLIRKYYKTKNFISIKCLNSIENNQYVEVYECKKDNRELVGILNVEKNNVIKKSSIIVVDVVNDDFDSKFYKDIQYNISKVINSRSLNQALIDVDVIKEEKFDLRTLPFNDPEVADFYNLYYLNQYIDANGVKYADNSLSISYLDDLIYLYEKYNNLPYQINSNQNPNTYLFYSSLSPYDLDINGSITGGTAGVASLCMEEGHSLEQWGNAVVVYANGDILTPLHEIGHSFKLDHTFDNREQFIFMQGYTDNMMDYPSIGEEDDLYLILKDKGKANPSDISSPYLNHHLNLFRWQWKLANSDRSAK